MENPFFRNGRWYQQPGRPRHPFSHSPSFGGVPVYPFDPARDTHEPVQRPPERNPGAKVVQIPVHFVGSGQADRSGSALKIQKVFRGFLVRKCLKKIKDIKAQVDEVEERLLRSDVVEVVRRDEKERLRMNENLMSLLFKLDSICGVDFGVRGCRKAVIRKAIALQERIDAIVAMDQEAQSGQTFDQEVECGQIVDQETESGRTVLNQTYVHGNEGGLGSLFENKEILGDDKKMEMEGDDEGIDVIDVGVDREEVKVISEEAKCVEDDSDEKSIKVDDNKRNRELLERMMEDNEKMMSLMTQLFERNETQTRMLNVLTQRVEMLEKAFVCDGKLRKKKKKKAATAVAGREN